MALEEGLDNFKGYMLQQAGDSNNDSENAVVLFVLGVFVERCDDGDFWKSFLRTWSSQVNVIGVRSSVDGVFISWIFRGDSPG